MGLADRMGTIPKAQASVGLGAMVPEDRTYTRNHEWVKLDAAIVLMGVTAPLLEALGPLVAVELPVPGDEMMLGVSLGAIEGLETIHEIMPPADATILEVNTGLEWDLDTLARDPYGEGWLMKIKVHEPDQLRNLLPAGMYWNLCKKQWGERE